MDILSQLQDQLQLIEQLTVESIGQLQRDAPPNRISPNLPEPSHPTPEDGAPSISDQSKMLSDALLKACKKFDSLIDLIPLTNPEENEAAQMKRIAELQAENDAVGQELQEQLEAAEKERNIIQELYKKATDEILNRKKPE